MKNKIEPLNLNRVKWTSLKGKKHKVGKALFARPWKKGGSLTDFLDSLPKILAGKDLREVGEEIAGAARRGKMVLMGMGAHPIKVGLSPILIDLMEHGVLKGIATNGAGLIHDVEVAMVGHTSEEVDQELSRGTFGLVK